MENKHRASTQKAQNQLGSKPEGLSSDTRLLHDGLLKNDSFELTQSEKQDKAFVFTLSGLDLEVSNSQAPSSLQWLKKFSHEQGFIEENSLEHLGKSRKSYNSFKKRLNSHLKNSRKSKSIEKYFQEHQYRELYNIILNLQSLPSFLLTLEGLKSYKACQIIAHEKGQAFASTSFCIDGEKTSSRRLPVEKFNKAFQTVKKSKSRLFSSQSFPENFCETIGSFMAKSFNGRKFNLILLIGRNDFLPPSDQELAAFDEVSINLEPIFNAILMRSNQDDKILNIMELLEGMPLPLSIKDKSDSFLFKNQAFEKLKENELKDYREIERSLTGKNTLSLFLDNSRNEETDLYHFYKVSLLGELLNTLRHELSNPLFGISLATDFLSGESEDEEVIQTIKDIKTNSLRCQQIIKNFSNLYEAEENFKDFDLINLVQETIILTKSEIRGIAKNIETNEKELVIFSNPTWISQVIFNLIINAGQALQDKNGDDLRHAKIVISLEATNNNVIISISDNGPGVPDSAKDKIFTPFFTTKEKGTGLGLSICRNLIKKLDGNMIYETSREQGSKFSISLPFVSQ